MDAFSLRTFSSPNRWLFVCCGPTVKVYNTTSHEPVHSLNGHKEVVTSCSINPSNTLQVYAYVTDIMLNVLYFVQLLTASLDGKVIIWDYIDGSLLRVSPFSLSLQPCMMYASFLCCVGNSIWCADLLFCSPTRQKGASDVLPNRKGYTTHLLLLFIQPHLMVFALIGRCYGGGR